MNFRANDKKATQAVARLIEKSGGPVDYLRVAKLVYLADRESILTRGIPIVGGHYFSMRKGPTIGEVMNFVNQRNAEGWKGTISPRFGNELRLEKCKPQFGALSQTELEILDGMVTNHITRTTEELVHWCHENCPEYEEVKLNGRKPIQVESILRGGKKSEKQIPKVVREAETIAELDSLLT